MLEVIKLAGRQEADQVVDLTSLVKVTGKATGKVIGKAMRKAIGKATALAKLVRQAKPIQTVPVCEQGVEPAPDQVIRTRSGRALVKRVIFDARKN